MKRADLDTVMMLSLIDQISTEGRVEVAKHGGLVQYVAAHLAGQVESTPDVPGRLPDVPYKVVLAKLYQLDRQRLIEYGTVITRPWLTPSGHAVLEGKRSAAH